MESSEILFTPSSFELCFAFMLVTTLGTPLGMLGTPLDTLWNPLGMLGATWVTLGTSLGKIVTTFGTLGTALGSLGTALGTLGPTFGIFGTAFGPLGTTLAGVALTMPGADPLAGRGGCGVAGLLVLRR